MQSLSWLVAALVLVGAVASVTAAEGDTPAALTYQIYGKLHGSAELLDNGKDSNAYLSSNSSRLGVKGDVGLQEGLNAVWQVESLVNLDESGSTFATRDSYVGLQSEYGRLIFGRFDSPFKTASRKTDMFGDQIGDTRNVLGVGTSGFDLRLDNVVMYTTPTIKGANLAASYKAPDAIENSDIGSAGLTWGGHGVTVCLAFEQHGTMVSGTDTNKDGKMDVASAEREQGMRAGATWKVGDLQLGALYEHVLNAGGVDGADRDTMGGGAAYAIGKFTVKGQYYVSGKTDGKPDTGATMMVGGVDYSLAKNTTVYLAYAATSNEEKAKVSMNGGGHGNKVEPALGDDPSGVSLGIIQTF